MVDKVDHAGLLQVPEPGNRPGSRKVIVLVVQHIADWPISVISQPNTFQFIFLNTTGPPLFIDRSKNRKNIFAL